MFWRSCGVNKCQQIYFVRATMKSRAEKSLIVPVSTPLESFSSRIRIKFSEVVCKDLTHESYRVPSYLPTPVSDICLQLVIHICGSLKFEENAEFVSNNVAKFILLLIPFVYCYYMWEYFIISDVWKYCRFKTLYLFTCCLSLISNFYYGICELIFY